MVTATELGIPIPGFGSALSYYDALRTERLPAALTQGLRDFFGAHTYGRIDADPAASGSTRCGAGTAARSRLSADFHSANRPSFCGCSCELVVHGAATEPGDGGCGQVGLAQYG